MKKLFAIAVSGAVGIAGILETAPPALAAEAAPAASVEQVRADAMARLAAGDIQEVGGRHGHHGGGHWGGHRGGGRHWGGGRRHWGGGRHWGHRRYYGGRRYYYGGRHHHHHGGGYVAAGVAGLIIGSAIASSNRPRYRSPCARGYRSFIGRDGRRYRCR